MKCQEKVSFRRKTKIVFGHARLICIFFLKNNLFIVSRSLKRRQRGTLLFGGDEFCISKIFVTLSNSNSAY